MENSIVCANNRGQSMMNSCLLAQSIYKDSKGKIGFNMGNPWVRISHTVPMVGMGSSQPENHVVSYETHGTFGTCGSFAFVSCSFYSVYTHFDRCKYN